MVSVRSVCCLCVYPLLCVCSCLCCCLRAPLSVYALVGVIVTMCLGSCLVLVRVHACLVVSLRVCVCVNGFVGVHMCAFVCCACLFVYVSVSCFACLRVSL